MFWDILLYEYLPYLSIGALVIGIVVRFGLMPSSVQAPSTQMLADDRSFRLAINLFHYGIVFVFLGHIFGLLTPEWAYTWLMSPHFKRFLAIVFGTLFGVMALVGCGMLILRRAQTPALSFNSSFNDYFIPLWLFVEIGLGLACVGVVIASPLETYVSFDEWAWGLLTLQPDAWMYIAGSNLVFYLHIVNGFLIFIAFPFTKMAHFLRAPLTYLLRPGQQVVWRTK